MRGYEMYGRNNYLRFEHGYESPCGVMSCYYPVRPATSGARYESPCGVMSCLIHIILIGMRWLRIPMRGYELSDTYHSDRHALVTNPHAGL